MNPSNCPSPCWVIWGIPSWTPPVAPLSGTHYLSLIPNTDPPWTQQSIPQCMTSRGTKSYSFLTGFTLPDRGFWFAKDSLSRCEPTLLKSSPYNIYRVNEKLLFLLQAYCSVMTLFLYRPCCVIWKGSKTPPGKMWSELNWPGSSETLLSRLTLYSCKVFSRVLISAPFRLL